jgi:AraC-like DNA-binding protein
MISMAPTDAAWERWLEALQDPRQAFSAPVCGTARTPDWGFDRRVLPEHMLHYVFAGSQVGNVAGQEVRTEPGSLLLVPAGVPQVLHADRARGELGIFFFRFRVGNVVPPALPFVRPGVPAAQPLVLQIYHESVASLPGQEQRIRALLALIFSEWWRAEERPARVLDAAQRSRLLALIDRRMGDRLDAAALARELGMTPTWFARQFRRTFGASPRSWLVRHRIHLAAQRLLASDEAIGRIAADLGYADLFLFSRQFRQVMGVSASAWRRRD